ncbi:protein FAR1-RELATED SEQUENCE 5-like [Sesbania bispinosa]|nr:protein FAR1-RELATED SEQUENCE 5-like [Sesbania bispinosa]
MVEFLHKFEQAKKEYRNNEMMAEFRSLFSEPVLTTYLRSFEKEASKIYTQEIFKEFKQEIEKANALIVCERSVLEENVMFTLKKFCTPGKVVMLCFILQTQVLCVTVGILNLENAKIDFMSHYQHDEMDSDVMEEACFAARDKVCTDGNPSAEHVVDPNSVKTKESGANDSEEDVMDTAEANVEQSNTNETKGGESNDVQVKGQQRSFTFDCTRQNGDKAKDKCKNKEKTCREDLKPKHTNEPVRMTQKFHFDICYELKLLKEIKLGGCSVGVKPANCQVPGMVSPIVPPMHFPINGYGSCSQGYPIHPNFSGGPIPNPILESPCMVKIPNFLSISNILNFQCIHRHPRWRMQNRKHETMKMA